MTEVESDCSSGSFKKLLKNTLMLSAVKMMHLSLYQQFWDFKGTAVCV